VGRLAPDRSSISASQIRDVIKWRFGTQVRSEVDEWRCAHGDLHWANVTHPQITLLDWEHWGLAPRGYDAAHLIVFSCALPDLVRKLEDAFAADLNTASGRIASLAILARRMDELDFGILDAACRPHLQAMAKRVLARNR
jgi:aminoglycoside phosphotransferase (APT) family kinase protein